MSGSVALYAFGSTVKESSKYEDDEDAYAHEGGNDGQGGLG